MRIEGLRDLSCGLSPRVRGNRRRLPGKAAAAGSIPACAGEPGIAEGIQRGGGVYPRVCGGTARQRIAGRGLRGLSPRVRGNLAMRRQHFLQVGSIPACAGEPWLRGDHGEPREVYPRVCGGTTDTDSASKTQEGLSPRVRGNPSRRLLPGVCGRSIPACAGEPQHRRRQLASRRVYPRVCGGTLLAGRPPGRWKGLSPRVRGNPAVLAAAFVAARSIPACAGEPLSTPTPAPIGEVYPRVCGGT